MVLSWWIMAFCPVCNVSECFQLKALFFFSSADDVSSAELMVLLI